ncbi:MAG: hypothetical protein KBD47_02780 [Candidatus Pacebacteria bacterium]|nr:hypothetical protein [Candidatus Paceibacterota bacterium]
MAFSEAVILKIVGAFATAVFAYIIGKKVIVVHRTSGAWGVGKILIIVSWFFKWGTLILFPIMYNGVLSDQSIAIMWLGSFAFGHFIVRPVGKILIV